MSASSINSSMINESIKKRFLNYIGRTDIYRINSFRILAVPISATTREISAQMRKIELMEKYGDNNNHFLSFIPLVPSPSNEDRRAAFSRINDPESRFIDELLWFWPMNVNFPMEEDCAINALLDSDIQTAIDIWHKHELDDSLTNVSMHNLAVLYHLLALDLEYEQNRTINKQSNKLKNEYWKAAYERWRLLLNNDSFWTYLKKRIRVYDDPRLSKNTISVVREIFPKACLSINAILAVNASKKGDFNEANFHSGLIRESSYSSSIVNDVYIEAITPIYDQINIICQESTNAVENNLNDGIIIAKRTLNQTSPLLMAVHCLLAPDHYLYKATHDEVANFGLNTVHTYAGETKDWETALELCYEVEKIAASQIVKQRVNDALESINAVIQYKRDYANCWFCKKRPAREDCVYEVPMYGNVERYGDLVHYNHGNVNVPRCKNCKSAHSRRRIFGTVFMVIGGLIGFGGCCYGELFVLGLILIAICTGIGYLTGWLIGYLTSIGIKTEKYGRQFSAVQEAVKKGFMFGDKPSGVK